MDQENRLQKGLLPRHVQFIALAGMIGTGIFKGSSDTLNIAGPSVVFAYLLGGLLLFIVMSALAEMASVFPNHNVQHLISKAFGSQTSFIMGWLYWINWIIVTVVEVLAAGSFLQFWFASAPLWLLALFCAIFVIAINLIQVKFYGEFEFYFAGIKIITLTLFILLGALMIFGVIPSPVENPLGNYTAHGGFFPNGAGGMLSAFLVVMFSYGGAELIGVAVTETKDAEKVLPKVIKSTVIRVILFYILPILIICGLIPWNEVSGKDSPFVQVFTSTGIPGAAHVMNFVLLTAVLSAANSGIYATSRTLFSMAQNGEAPKRLAGLTKQGIPINGIALTAASLLIGVFLAYKTPGEVISYLMTIPGFTVLLLWLGICMAQLKLRKSYPSAPFFKMKWAPFTTIAASLALILIFISFVFNKQNAIGTTVCLIILAVLAAASFFYPKALGKSRKIRS
ncbi:amino acid permease [Metabacillus sp. GX 13764]|uniref:amino acid permease n=1 Tax=Metabacillus kandeliae TaxID=2900151 RepID=UPI001E472530|nr:amino acid permease [Metabacillus kandeliae]MCD7035849.1 amino acid permease [Metabacillus kandeliae]